MSLLGKIFALLNTMLAFGLGVILIMDLGARRNWTYLVFRQDLAIHGLPLDSEETTSTGTNISANLTDSIVKSLFSEAGNLPVFTQVEEVKRVYTEYEKKEKELADDKSRDLLNAKILLEHAITYTDRLALQRFIRENKADDLAKKWNVEPAKVSEQLKVEVTNLFLVSATLEKSKVPAGAVKISQTESRSGIANLLLTMYQVFRDEGMEAYANDTYLNRLVVVTGPDQASKAMEGRGVVLRRDYDDLEAQLKRDHSNFVTEHRELLAEMRVRATETHDAEAFVKDYESRIKIQQGILAKEKDHLQKMETELAKERNDTSLVVSELKNLSEGLFQVYKKLLGVREGNEARENKLTSVEKNH